MLLLVFFDKKKKKLQIALNYCSYTSLLSRKYIKTQKTSDQLLIEKLPKIFPRMGKIYPESPLDLLLRSTSNQIIIYLFTNSELPGMFYTNKVLSCK
jgi:hypothetical protein